MAAGARIAIIQRLLLLALLLPPSSVVSADDDSSQSAAATSSPVDESAGAPLTGEASTFMAASDSSHMQILTPSYKPAANCYAGQTCEDGACLQAQTYNSTTGCGAARQEAVSSNCSCGLLCIGFTNGSLSSSCSLYYPRLCCNYSYTCRNYSACSWTAPAPFASGGAWNGSADTNQETNAYLAGILAAYVYEGSVGSTPGSQSDFVAKFSSLVAKPLGFNRAWVYYRDYGLVWVFLEATSSIIATFRGTEGVVDDLIDLTSLGSTVTTDFGAEPGMGEVWIGAGFYEQFNASKEYFLSELARFKASASSAASAAGKALWIVGHSLGAAEASLFSAYAERNGHPVAGVYAFASPIVGNAAWKAAYPLGSKTYRYEVPGDVVPYLPPISLDPLSLNNYSNHVGIPVIASPCAAAPAATAVTTTVLLHQSLLLKPAAASSYSDAFVSDVNTPSAVEGAAAAAATSTGSDIAAAAAAAAAADAAAASSGMVGTTAAADGNDDPAAATSGSQQGQQRMCGVARVNLGTIPSAVVPTDSRLCSARPSSSSNTSVAAAAAAATAAAAAAVADSCDSRLPPQASSSATASCHQQQAGNQLATTVAATNASLLPAAQISPLLPDWTVLLERHSILRSYTKNVYFCLLSLPTQAAMPSYTRSVLAFSFHFVNSSSYSS